MKFSYIFILPFHNACNLVVDNRPFVFCSKWRIFGERVGPHLWRFKTETYSEAQTSFGKLYDFWLEIDEILGT